MTFGFKDALNLGYYPPTGTTLVIFLDTYISETWLPGIEKNFHKGLSNFQNDLYTYQREKKGLVIVTFL